jgi:uncharacterized protein YndB with AHSA1/START domain
MKSKKLRAILVMVIATAACRSAAAQDIGPIVEEVVVEAALDRVWAAFTTSEGLQAWMAPHAEIDLRLGGLMRTNYNPQGALGDAQTIENVILSFEPQRMLSMKVARPPANFPFPNAVPHMWSVLYFSAAGPSRTTVRGVSLGFGSDPESQRMREFFSAGNATTMSRLVRHFASPAGAQ